MMEVLSVQLIVIFVLLIGNFITGLLPAFWLKIIDRIYRDDSVTNKKSRTVMYFLYFGGGIFITVCFLNLLPKTQKEYVLHRKRIFNEKGEISVSNHTEELENTPHEQEHTEDFPFPEFIVLCGFFATFIIQEALCFLFFHFRKAASTPSDVRIRFCSCAKRHTECSRTFKVVKTEQTMFGMEKKKLLESGSAAGLGQPGINRSCDNAGGGKGNLMRSSIIAQPLPNYGAVTNAAEPCIDDPGPVLTPTVILTDDAGIVTKKISSESFYSKIPVTISLTVMVLSLQAILQGMTLGIVAESTQEWQSILIICIQQLLITFSVGAEALAGSEKLSHVMPYTAILSSMSPVGIIIAMLVKDSVNCISHTVLFITNAVLCGALIFITFHEILRQRSEVRGLRKFSAIILGTGFMTVLQYVT